MAGVWWGDGGGVDESGDGMMDCDKCRWKEAEAAAQELAREERQRGICMVVDMDILVAEVVFWKRLAEWFSPDMSQGTMMSAKGEMKA